MMIPCQNLVLPELARRVLIAAWALLLPVATLASSPDSSAMVQREIDLLQFYGGGSPLSAQERQEAADTVEHALQTVQRQELAADAGAAKLLQVLQHASPQLIALARESGRLNAQLHDAVDPALQQQQVMEARIIAAHDPVVVFDAAHKRLITMQTLRVLQRADTYGATVFNVPPPGPDFDKEMQQSLPAAYPNLDDGMQDALAHAERDLPYAPGLLQGIAPQKRTALIQIYRAKILAAPDSAGQQLALAEVMAVVGATAFHLGQTSGTSTSAMDQLQMQNLLNRQLEGAARSYSPTCNVTRPDAMANWTFCHP